MLHPIWLITFTVKILNCQLYLLEFNLKVVYKEQAQPLLREMESVSESTFVFI